MQKTAYEMRISDWSSDVCSSDLLHAAPGDALLQKIAVNRRMARHEGGAETGREGRLGLGHADLGPRDARGIARKEVIHRLIGGQLRDRGQHAIDRKSTRLNSSH